MDTAILIALEKFFYGFGVTVAMLTVLTILLYLAYIKSKKPALVPEEERLLPKWLEQAERSAADNQAAGNDPLSFGYAFKSMIAVITIALLTALIIYLWTIGFRPYDGTVDRKRCRKGYQLQIYVCSFDVRGNTYTIGEGLYHEVNPGDKVRRPFAAPWTYVNGKPVVYELALTFFGVFCGILSAIAGVIVMLIWASYYA